MIENADCATLGMAPSSSSTTAISRGRICLVLISIEFLETVTTEITPTIVWCLLGGQRQRRLVLVEQHLEEWVAVGRTLAIEDELHIAGHGECVVVDPPFRFQLVQVVGNQSKAIDIKQTEERKQDCLVTF